MWPSTGQNSGYKTNHNKTSLSGDRSPFTSTLLSLCFPYQLSHRHKFDKTSSRSTPWSLWATEEMLHRTVAASLRVDLLHIYIKKGLWWQNENTREEMNILVPLFNKETHNQKVFKLFFLCYFLSIFKSPVVQGRTNSRVHGVEFCLFKKNK